MSIYSGFYTSNYANYEANGVKRKAEYLFYTELSEKNTDEDEFTYNPTIVGLKTYG